MSKISFNKRVSWISGGNKIFGKVKQIIGDHAIVSGDDNSEYVILISNLFLEKPFKTSVASKEEKETKNPSKVLIIANDEDSGEPSFILSKYLREKGFSINIWNNGDSKQIISDDISDNIDINKYSGVIFLDDGGDKDSSVILAKKFNKESLMVSGFGEKGCLVLEESGVLKDKFLCIGLPDSYYKKGSEKVNSPSVRSDNVVTGNGKCIDSFIMLVLDAVGGEKKKIIHGEDIENNIKETKKDKDALISEAMDGVIDIDKSNSGIKIACIMKRSKFGWLPFGSEFDESVVDTSEKICVAFQSVLDNPNDSNELGIVIKINEEGKHSLSEIETKLPQKETTDRWIIERELSKEGIWLQPDGNFAISINGNFEKRKPLDTISFLRSEAIRNTKREIDIKDLLSKTIAKRSRHIFVLVCQLCYELVISGDIKIEKVAGVYDSTVCGPYANLDLPMSERVFQFEEGDDWLTDREKSIGNLPRYNPEYFGSEDDQFGYYFVWNEPRREPTSWLGILEGDGINPTRKILQRK